MPWGHENHEPFYLSIGYFLQDFSENNAMPKPAVSGTNLVDELDERERLGLFSLEIPPNQFRQQGPLLGG